MHFTTVIAIVRVDSIVLHCFHQISREGLLHLLQLLLVERRQVPGAKLGLVAKLLVEYLGMFFLL